MRPLPLSAQTPEPAQVGVEILGSGLSKGAACAPSPTAVCDPFAMAFDPKGDLWIADGQDNRVLEFPLVGANISSTASAVIGQQSLAAVCGAGPSPQEPSRARSASPTGSRSDSSGDLWVADGGGNRIVEFPLVDGSISGVGEILGRTSPRTSPTRRPTAWPCPWGSPSTGPGTSGSATCQTAGSSSSLSSGFDSPGPIEGHRPEHDGSGACDQSTAAFNFENATSSDLCFPSDLAFDQRGDLWVADFGQDPNIPGDSRVVMFPFVNGSVSATASTVIGQSSFYGLGCNRASPSPASDALCYPSSIAFDPSGNLWVADSGNSRVLEFPASGGSISGLASQVIGQGNFTAGKCNMGGTSASLGLPMPSALAGLRLPREPMGLGHRQPEGDGVPRPRDCVIFGRELASDRRVGRRSGRRGNGRHPRSAKDSRCTLLISGTASISSSSETNEWRPFPSAGCAVNGVPARGRTSLRSPAPLRSWTMSRRGTSTPGS